APTAAGSVSTVRGWGSVGGHRADAAIRAGLTHSAGGGNGIRYQGHLAVRCRHRDDTPAGKRPLAADGFGSTNRTPQCTRTATTRHFSRRPRPCDRGLRAHLFLE